MIACVARFYLLGSNPPSIDWDEASLGYNAYSILKTGADEYGNILPLSIRSFDDYKPPLYVYLAIPSVALFGLNEWSVRLPSAIIGLLAVFVMYHLTKQLLSFEEKERKESFALLSAFFLAISPWHLQFSRAAFEGNVGLFFLMSGISLFFLSLKRKPFLLVSVLFFVLSMYSYHSFRVVTPMIMLGLFFLYWREIIKNKQYTLASVLLCILLTIPIAYSFVSAGAASSRLSMVTSFGESDELKRSIRYISYDQSSSDVLGQLFHNRRAVYIMQAVKGYLDHWNPNFLFIYGDGGRQHHAVDMGMLYLFDLPFLIIGIIAASRIRKKNVIFLFLWILFAPLASSITTGTPHPVRAIPMVPPLHIFVAIGLYSFIVFFRQYKKIFYPAVFITVFALLINILYYFHQYYVHTPIEYGDFWQYGYKEALHMANAKEDTYEKIVMTYTYDQPYIYYLFYNKIDPAWYQKHWNDKGDGSIERMRRVIGKYEFRNIDFGEDRNLHKTLLIGSPNEIPPDAPGIIEEIFFPNGDVSFRLVET